MKTITLLKSCMLAYSVLAGAYAVAGPVTVNSIEFSFMNYTTKSPVFSSSSGNSLGSMPSLLPTPIEDMSIIPPPAPPKPVIGAFGPPPPEPASTSLFIQTSQSPVRAAAEAVPEPGTLALLSLGLCLLVVRRRGGAYA